MGAAMGATYVHEGNAIDYRPTWDVPAGTVIVLGALVGVARQAIKANQLGSLAVTGVFDFPKSPDDSIPAGAELFWNGNDGIVAMNSEGGMYPRLGNAVNATGLFVATVRVRLNTGIP